MSGKVGNGTSAVNFRLRKIEHGAMSEFQLLEEDRAVDRSCSCIDAAIQNVAVTQMNTPRLRVSERDTAGDDGVSDGEMRNIFALVKIDRADDQGVDKMQGKKVFNDFALIFCLDLAT